MSRNLAASLIALVNSRAGYVFTENFSEFFKNEIAGTCFNELIDYDPAVSHAQDDTLTAIKSAMRRFLAHALLLALMA